MNKYNTIDAAALRDVLGAVAYCAAPILTRHPWVGVYVCTEDDILRAVATDGMRLALAERPVGGDFRAPEGFIVPLRGVYDIITATAGETLAAITVDADALHVRTDSGRVRTKLIDARFPQYKRVIPECGGPAVVFEKSELFQALRRMQMRAHWCAVLAISPGRIVITTPASASRQEIPAAYDGEPMQIAIDTAALAAAIDRCPGSEVALYATAPHSPVAIRPVSGPTYVAVIAPMRIEHA